MYRLIKEAPLRFPPQLSSSIKDVIRKLLIRDPKRRLGSGSTDVQEITKHSFFKDHLNMTDLYAKKIKPPYRPVVLDGSLDTSNFDTQFTDEPVVDSYVQQSKLTEEFSGFTFVPEKNK